MAFPIVRGIGFSFDHRVPCFRRCFITAAGVAPVAKRFQGSCEPLQEALKFVAILFVAVKPPLLTF
jgi:hypothetical protein